MVASLTLWLPTIVAPKTMKSVAWGRRLSPSRRPVCTENLNPNIVVMKPAKDRV